MKFLKCFGKCLCTVVFAALTFLIMGGVTVAMIFVAISHASGCGPDSHIVFNRADRQVTRFWKWWKSL